MSLVIETLSEELRRMHKQIVLTLAARGFFETLGALLPELPEDTRGLAPEEMARAIEAQLTPLLNTATIRESGQLEADVRSAIRTAAACQIQAGTRVPEARPWRLERQYAREEWRHLNIELTFATPKEAFCWVRDHMEDRLTTNYRVRNIRDLTAPAVYR